MATAELTQAAPRDTPYPRHPSHGGLCHLHGLIAVALTVCTATLVGGVLGVVAPGLAPSGQPHPTLHGTLREALGIAATNVRVLAAPFLLALFGLARRRTSRLLGDLLVAGLMLANTLRVGIAIGRFGTRLLPYLPQLPLEWAGADALRHGLAADPHRRVRASRMSLRHRHPRGRPRRRVLRNVAHPTPSGKLTQPRSASHQND